MGKFKKLCLATALVFGCGQAAMAKDNTTEKDYKSYPHMFFGLHGGGQLTFTNYKNSKLITPMYGASFWWLLHSGGRNSFARERFSEPWWCERH